MSNLIETVTGVVLAGGKSSRMGTDKATLQFEGLTLVERAAETLRRCFARVIVIAQDDVPNLGPLGGLLTALRHLNTEAVFLVACDMPFLNAVLIRDMADALGNFDAVVPNVEGRFEPLHATYSARIASAVERQIATGDYSMHGLLTRLNVKTLSEVELSRYPDWRRALLNVNTPDELEKVRELLGTNRGGDAAPTD